MTDFVRTGAAGFGLPGQWTLGGGAADDLDAITSRVDGKYSDWSYISSGVGQGAAFRVYLAALSAVPTGVVVDARFLNQTGSGFDGSFPKINGISLRDAAGVLLAQVSSEVTLIDGLSILANLTQVYSGPVDDSGDWTLEISLQGDAVSTTVQIHYVAVSYGGTSDGGSGSGPGGQDGPNASILIPLMVQP